MNNSQLLKEHAKSVLGRFILDREQQLYVVNLYSQITILSSLLLLGYVILKGYGVMP